MEEVLDGDDATTVDDGVKDKAAEAELGSSWDDEAE